MPERMDPTILKARAALIARKVWSQRLNHFAMKTLRTVSGFNAAPLGTMKDVPVGCSRYRVHHSDESLWTGKIESTSLCFSPRAITLFH